MTWLYRFNAALKCWRSLRTYRGTVARYASLPSPRTAACPPAFCARLREAGGRRPRVFFMGTDEQQDKSGLFQALQRVADVEPFVRDDGGWGQNDPAPYALRRARNTARLREILSRLASRAWVPDLLVAQTWGLLVDPEALAETRKRYGAYIINIAMDDRHQFWGRKVNGVWDGTYSLIPHIDLSLTSAPEAVEWYHKEGGAALFFPGGSDPHIFRTYPDCRKIYDVSFVGSRYGVRGGIVLALRAAGINVAAFGTGWENGRAAIEEVPRIFAQSKIVLGVSAIGHCLNFVALKLRDFDAPMSGTCYLTQENPDLHELYEVDREIVTYRTVAECVDKARALLADSSARESIGGAGQARAVQDHTWDRRFETLFSVLRGDCSVSRGD